MTVSADPDVGLTAPSSTGEDFSIGIPGNNTADGTVIAGSTVYPDVAADASVVARPTSEGVQALIVIDGADAPTRYRFPVEVGTVGADLELRSDGTVELRQPGSTEPAALVLPAWATDAAGNPVPTRYEINGSTLVQVVDHHGATYPVTADPNTCGIATCTYYFGKKATKDIATGAAGLGVCAVIGRFGLPGAVVGAVCGIYGAAVVVQANRAKNRSMCLKIKYSRIGGAPIIPDIYKDSRCK